MQRFFARAVGCHGPLWTRGTQASAVAAIKAVASARAVAKTHHRTATSAAARDTAGLLAASHLIPRVDFSKSDDEVLESILAAADAGGPGFFYLTNHGVDVSVFEDMIAEAHKFYSQDASVKRGISALGYALPPGADAEFKEMPTKGYAAPGTEGAYEKDPATDVRPDGETATLALNSRESVVFRYPELGVEAEGSSGHLLQTPKYVSNYTEFLSSALGGDIAHPSNRIDGLSDETINTATRAFFAKNQWPSWANNGGETFKTSAELYFKSMSSVADRVFRLFDRLQSDDATPLRRDLGMTTFNITHYPLVKSDSSGLVNSENSFGIADHTDWECFTLLYPAFLNRGSSNPYVDQQTGIAFTGLQVWFQDQWVPVPHVPGTIIVNQGEMLSRLSRGRFKAPVHRVVNEVVDQNRYSLVSFWGLNYEALLPDSDMPCGNILAGEYYLKRNAFLPKAKHMD